MSRQAKIIELRKMKVPPDVRAARQEALVRLLAVVQRAIGFPIEHEGGTAVSVIFNTNVEATECQRLLHQVSRGTRRHMVKHHGIEKRPL
jgi:hypothetical protein